MYASRVGMMHLQQRNAIVLIRLHKNFPSGSREGRRIAPLVIVDRVEIAARHSITAIHVLSHQVLVLRHVGSGITDGNLAVAALADVLLHITGYSLDVRRSSGTVGCIDDLVPTEEE